MNITQQLWTAKEWARVKATGSDYVILVHGATNEDKWGPTGPQMEEVCRAFPRGNVDIMEEIGWRLKNRDKSWRACYKSLLVLDYLARNAGDTYLPEICSVVPVLRTIAQSFYYTNPKGIDHGVSVRERAKNLADLLSDGLLLREERAKAAQTRAKLACNSNDSGGPGVDAGRGGDYGGGGRSGGSYRTSHTYDPYDRSPAFLDRSPPPIPQSKEEQERYDMEMAIRMQREEERRAGVSAEKLEQMYHRKVQRRKQQEQRSRTTTHDDEDFARRLQEEEDARARREGIPLPTLRSDAMTLSAPPVEPSAMPSTVTQTAAQLQAPPQKKADVLDDLFAPIPQPQATAPPTATAADPFEAFLDNRNNAASPQGWGQFPQQPQQAQSWSQPPQPQQQQPGQPQVGHADPFNQPPPQGWGLPSQQQQQQGQSWGQPQQPPQQQWGQQPPEAQSDWGQSTHQQQQPQWRQQGDTQWGQATQAPSPPMQYSNGNSLGDIFGGQPQQQVSQQWGKPEPAVSTTNDMWGTLDQFAQQQQRRGQINR